jgi:hypothetical protein
MASTPCSDSYWDINQGIEYPVPFFRLISKLLPEATLCCTEGTRIAPEVRDTYARHSAPERNPAPRNTFFPWAPRYVCRCSPAFWLDLINTAQRRPAAEVLDHLFIYAGERCLIQWHDAFANAMLLDGSLPEATVAALADPFGVGYGRSR